MPTNENSARLCPEQNYPPGDLHNKIMLFGGKRPSKVIVQTGFAPPQYFIQLRACFIFRIKHGLKWIV